MVDVSGIHSEKKRWLHFFADATVVIFMVALSEYDHSLQSGQTTTTGETQMHESLQQFGDVINHVWFKDTPIILLLNKKDVFEEKIKKQDLNVCFSDYKGGKNYESAVEFVKQKFLEKNKVAATLYLFVSCCHRTPCDRNIKKREIEGQCYRL